MDAPVPSATARGEAIRVRGLVQGVGFRPTVWRLARECALAGDVRNDAEGVLIRAWGADDDRERFTRRLRAEAPPLSRIDALEASPLEEPPDCADFRIAPSRSGHVHTGIVPDAATCPACMREVLDPDDRRHRYPFTNCTHCGPRLSIVQRIPYDRPFTSMSAFPMCERCRAEYENPADRRFHAQPNACPDCGPRLWLERLENGTRDPGPGTGKAETAGTRESGNSSRLLPFQQTEDAEAGSPAIHDSMPRATRSAALSGPGSRVPGPDFGDDPIRATQCLLRAGSIVAIKGLGGFHLAADATNAEAVARLRQRKRRPDKPFALMARDIAQIRRYCSVSDTEAELLGITAAPIVLLRVDGQERLTAGVAPRQRRQGFMLPYTPLHHLLMAGLDAPIVLTSGNRSEEPQCTANDEARERLGDIADALLLHDREIVNRLDDSVARMDAAEPVMLRRARGYAPAPIAMPAGFGEAPEVLAFGGELKNTFCLLRDGQAILSQHLGDMANARANAGFDKILALYLKLFKFRPHGLAADRHPEYLTGKLARAFADEHGLPLIAVQHHHAHVAACMVDNGLPIDSVPVLGLAFDGLGFGNDGTLWGGEFLLAEYRGYRRLASLVAVPMPGGERAIEQPWRMAYAHLRRLPEWPRIQRDCAALPFFRKLAGKPLASLDGMIAAAVNSPPTSSCGRLFDAVAAVAGLRQTVSYEGQAAMELEAVLDPTALRDGLHYPFTAVIDGAGLPRLDPAPMWPALLADLRAGVAVGVVSARFHAGLVKAVVAMVEHLARMSAMGRKGRVALSGGVFQNATLTSELRDALQACGHEVLTHHRIPPNDGGLSLGQAAVAAARALDSGGAASSLGSRTQPV